MMPFQREWCPIDEATERAMKARFDAMIDAELLKREHEQHLREFGLAIVRAGISLIPSEHLADNQVLVSRDVYDAAVRVLEGKEGPGHAYFSKRGIPR